MSTHQGQELSLDHAKIEWLILADEAEVVNGKLYMMGGDGIGSLRRPCRGNSTWRFH